MNIEKELDYFSDMVRHHRLIQEPNLTEFSRKSGVSRNAIKNIENGGNPQLYNLLKLSKSLGVEIVIKKGIIEITDDV